MVYKPVNNPARWEGVVVCGWILLSQLLLAQWIANRSTDWLRFVLAAVLLLSVPLLLHVAYRTWIAFSLEYWLDRNSLTVRCADMRQTIPLGNFKRILLSNEGPADPLTPRQMWAAWPSPYVGIKRIGLGSEAQEVAVFASQPLTRCLLLDATTAAPGSTVPTANAGAEAAAETLANRASNLWALSPEDAASFVDALQQRVRQGPVAQVAERYERRFDPAGFLNVDKLGALLIGLGLLSGAALLGVFMVRFPGLPDVLTTRFTGEGVPELVREKESLFILPILGLLAWLVNSVSGMLMAGRRQISAAYLLWGGTLVVQLCAFAALIGLIGWT